MKQTSIVLMSRIKAYLLLVLMAVLVFSLSGCGDDDDDDPPPLQDIVDVAIANGYNTLAAALVAADLDDDLRGTGPFTVFAPTDEAFEELDITADNVSNVANLEDILLYHVISGSVRSSDLTTGTVPTLLENAGLAIDATNLTVNGISIITPFDVEASNGIIHTIDGVLLPPAEPVELDDIVTLATESEDLTVLEAALTKFPDLVDLLSTDGSYTVFAPTDAAFTTFLDVIGQTDLDDIPESVLRRVLEYHVVVGTAAFSADLTNGQTIETALMEMTETGPVSETVTIGVDDTGVTVNDANVTTADVEANNGVVHIIDAVLVPAFELTIVNTVVEPAYFNKDFSTLTAAVVAADLLTTLIDTDAEYTVFAPTNDAFAAAGITELPSDTDELTNVLLYHVLDSEVKAADLPATGSAVPTLNGDFYLSINTDGVFINGSTEVVETDIDQDNGVVHVIDRTLIPAAGNIVEIAAAANQTDGTGFGQLVAAVTAVQEDMSTSDLVDILSSAESEDDGAPFTLFAPNDDAFAQLYTDAGVADLDELINAVGIATLEAVLLYHVIGEARVFSSDLPNLTSNEVPTLGGVITFDLTVTPPTITETDDVLMLNEDDEAALVLTGIDILATNGVIHTIDKVILP
ncbi:MAG: fasciclin domain-containing protein [Bacteroidota bacterium]